MVIPQHFFPFGESFDARMGGRPLQPDEPLCDVDPAAYVDGVQHKRNLLQEAHAEYFRGGAHILAAQWEVLALALDDLAAHYPAHFSLEKRGADWRWRNRLLGEEHNFRFGEAASLPHEPLDWVGRQVQEDLVLVSAEADRRFIGGQLCFANAWSLGSHLGKTFLDIHVPIPNTTQPAVHTGYRLLERLKPLKTIWRLNWNFKLSPALDLSTRRLSRYAAEAAARLARLTPATAGEELFLRVERQTLTCLPGTGVVLFGIHTYISRLEDEAADPQRVRNILAVLRSAPPDVKEYKAFPPFEAALLGYLEARG